MFYRLWYNAGKMLPAGHLPQHLGCNIQQAVTYILVLLKNGQYNCPKYVELTGNINKLLLSIQLVVLFISMINCQVISDNEIYLLNKYIESVLWGLEKRLSYIEYARCLKGDLLQFTKLFFPRRVYKVSSVESYLATLTFQRTDSLKYIGEFYGNVALN